MEPTEQELARFVDAHINCCLSSLVSTLAKSAHGAISSPSGHNPYLDGAIKDTMALCDRAAELCSPVEDYEEAARQEGYEVRHDLHGFYVLDKDEAAHEDAGNPSAGFDGRAHFATIDEAWHAVCEADNLGPYEWEIFEHWAVSEWFAEQLEARGERVDRDFAGLCVWGRTTTGQSISMDAVVEAIWRELHKETA